MSAWNIVPTREALGQKLVRIKHEWDHRDDDSDGFRRGAGVLPDWSHAPGGLESLSMI